MRKLKKYKPTKFMAEDSVYSQELADYAVSVIECNVCVIQKEHGRASHLN